MNYFYSNSLGKNGYGAVNIFLAPAYNKINNPSKEEKEAYPNFGGYDLEEFSKDQPQHYAVTHIVKFLVTTKHNADGSKVIAFPDVKKEDIFTFFVFSPWEQEKNAINQAREYLKKYKVSTDYHQIHWSFLSCEKM